MLLDNRSRTWCDNPFWGLSYEAPDQSSFFSIGHSRDDLRPLWQVPYPSNHALGPKDLSFRELGHHFDTRSRSPTPFDKLALREAQGDTFRAALRQAQGDTVARVALLRAP